MRELDVARNGGATKAVVAALASLALAVFAWRPFSPSRRLSTDVDVFVQRPCEEVFAFVVDPRNEPLYNRTVHDVRMISAAPLGVGSSFAGRHRGFGDVTWTLTELTPPGHVVIDGLLHGAPYRWTSEFESRDGGTVIKGRMEWEPQRAWRFIRPLLPLLLKARARMTFRKLGRILEQLAARDYTAATTRSAPSRTT